MSDNWRWIKLSHAYPRIGSGTTPPDELDNYVDDGSGTNWVTTSELRECHISETKKQVSDDALKRYPTLRVYRPGSVLFAMYGATIGRLGVLDQPACCNQACCVFERSKTVSNRYLVYWLQHRRSDLVALSVGGGQPNLSQQDLRNERVYCPDLATQRQIADFLDRETARIDLLIEKKQRLVALLGEKAKRDISSTFERLAHNHRIWRLKHVLLAGLAYGANEPSDGDDPDDVRYIRITDIDADGNLRDDTFKSLPRERVRDYILEDGDILFARSGATVGKSFIYREHMGECCYAGYLIRARVNTTLISPNFLKHFTSTDQYWNHILGTNIQATIQNVSAEKYANLAFPVPPLSIQDEISEKLSVGEERYAATKRSANASIDRLKEYRSALITAAVTGQIDVRAFTKSGTPDRRLDAIQEEMGA